MSSNDVRFETVYKEGSAFSSSVKKIIRDNETGVEYLLIECGYGVSITPLLDKDGKPIVEAKYQF